MALVLAFASTGAANAQTQSDDRTMLWQGLATGMTPEEALPAVHQIGGVKRAKVLKERKSNPERRIDIDYVTAKIPIANLPFELGPIFKDGRLSQVLLAARNQCGANATQVLSQLTTGLRGKYADAIGAPELSDRDFREAERNSLVSGEPSTVATAFANGEVAVFLTFRVTVEARPPYPTSYSKLGYSLWQLANLQYEQRQAECSGTGDRRVDVVLIYMPRSASDAARADTAAEQRDKADRIADQL